MSIELKALDSERLPNLIQPVPVAAEDAGALMIPETSARKPTTKAQRHLDLIFFNVLALPKPRSYVPAAKFP
jgi:hypothetical protein